MLQKMERKILVSFQSTFVHLFHFPIALVFPALWLILLNISPMPIEPLAVIKATFLKLFSVSHNFPLHGPLSAISGWITALIYEVMAYHVAFDIKQFPWNAISECIYWVSIFPATFKSQLSSDPFCTSSLIWLFFCSLPLFAPPGNP